MRDLDSILIFKSKIFVFSRYHSLQYDAAENSHQSKSDRKANGGSKHGILKESSYTSKDNNGIRQQSVSSNSKYSSSSSSSRDHSGHHFSNNVEENRISKVRNIFYCKTTYLLFFIKSRKPRGYM